MYYVKEIEDKIRLPPDEFKSEREEVIARILREQYERRLFKELGFVISLFDVKISGDGLVIPGDGAAYYTVKFNLLTFMPYVNEVYYAEIKDLVDFGAFAGIGPIQGLIHISQLASEKFSYNKKAKKIVSRSGKLSVKKGDKCMVKISTVSMKATVADTRIGLTMRPQGLGRIEWVEKEAERENQLRRRQKVKKK